MRSIVLLVNLFTTFQEPHQLAEGVSELYVDGRLTIRGGVPTGELGGDVLRPGN